MEESNFKEEYRKEKAKIAARRRYLRYKEDPEYVRKRRKYMRKYTKNLKKTNPEAYQRKLKIMRDYAAKIRARAKMFEKLSTAQDSELKKLS